MEAAAEQARLGNLAHFQNLEASELQRLCKSKDEDGRTLLHAAAASGSMALIELLAGGASVTEAVMAQDDEGWTPLHSATSCGHEDVALWLLKQGADVNAANSGKRTPLHYAVSKGSTSLVEGLLQHGADVRARDMNGSTPLHRAAATGRSEAARILIEKGKANVEAADTLGSTPLLVALECDHNNTALFLAQKGADLEAANKEGLTPLQASGALRDALLQAASKQGDEGMSMV